MQVHVCAYATSAPHAHNSTHAQVPPPGHACITDMQGTLLVQRLCRTADVLPMPKGTPGTAR